VATASRLSKRLKERHSAGFDGGVAVPDELRMADARVHAMRIETTKLINEIRREVIERIPMGADMDDVALQAEIKAAIARRDFAAQGIMVDEEQLLREIKYEMRGYGIVQPLLDDPSVSEIMINGPGPGNIWVERNGMMQPMPDIFYTTPEEIEHLAQRVMGPIGRSVDNKIPYANGWILAVDRIGNRLYHRVHVVIPPIAPNGPCVTIRKHRKPLTAEELVDNGTISREAVQFLYACVAAGLSLIVSGGTSSGKTNTLNGLISFVPHHERMVVIQDVRELQVTHPNAPLLLTRDANMEGEGMVAYEDLVEQALRMAITWIILGEARGKEAYGIDNAANTGHHVMFTMHSNGPRETVARFETMIMKHPLSPPYRAVQRSIAQNFDLIVHQERVLGADGRVKRRVVAITEIQGMGRGEYAERVFLNDQFVYDRDSDVLVKRKAPTFLPQLLKTGLPVPNFAA